MTTKEIDLDILNIVKKYVEKITKEFTITAVYLFGSYAKGTEHEDSDIDVAIILDSNSDVIDLMVELMMLTENIDLRIEPHPIKVKDLKGNPFIDEIKNTGLKVA